MTQKGRGGPALAIAVISSFVAGTVGVLALTMLAPTLAAIALRFGPPEYTGLLLSWLLMLGYMSKGLMSKTLAMALLIGLIGIDAMTGYTRFTFGLINLFDGIGIVPAAVGLFGLSEILMSASS